MALGRQQCRGHALRYYLYHDNLGAAYAMEPDGRTRLWTVRVGSHAWSMNHEDSDVDLFTAYMVPTMQILEGRESYNAHVTHDPEHKLDEQRHEIKLWVDRAIDGNLNYLIGAFSDHVEFEMQRSPGLDPYMPCTDTYLEEFRKLTGAALSQRCYGSIAGTVYHNLRLIERKKLTPADPSFTKRMAGIVRTAEFGVELLTTGMPVLRPVDRQEAAKADESTLIGRLEKARDGSPLPPRCPEQVERSFRGWLSRLRLAELYGELQ